MEKITYQVKFFFAFSDGFNGDLPWEEFYIWLGRRNPKNDVVWACG